MNGPPSEGGPDEARQCGLHGAQRRYMPWANALIRRRVWSVTLFERVPKGSTLVEVSALLLALESCFAKRPGRYGSRREQLAGARAAIAVGAERPPDAVRLAQEVGALARSVQKRVGGLPPLRPVTD